MRGFGLIKPFHIPTPSRLQSGISTWHGVYAPYCDHDAWPMLSSRKAERPRVEYAELATEFRITVPALEVAPIRIDSAVGCICTRASRPTAEAMSAATCSAVRVPGVRVIGTGAEDTVPHDAAQVVPGSEASA